MLKISNVEISGWNAAIRGMRNPKNSWHLSDSYWTYIEDPETGNRAPFEFFVGENDLKLATTLANAGTDHGKLLRFIRVDLDINAPFYWWKEFDTYKVGTVANSCSTMHKIHSKKFELDDFSHEYLRDAARRLLVNTIEALNIERDGFNGAISPELKNDRQCWYSMIQLLPTSYNQLRTISLNYAVLRAMYHARRHHKLTEWHTFCDWIETLPYAKELIIGE